MRVSGRATSLSWIPSESVAGVLKGGFDLGLSHYDEPPVDNVGDTGVVTTLRDDDRFRFANVLTGWADFADEGVSAGYGEDSGLLMGNTNVRLGVATATFLGFSMPTLQAQPQVHDDRVVLVQTVGGRTGAPLPRPVPHPPYVCWHAPLVWTTLQLTLHRDGRREVALVGASAFPRHWVYDADGALALKSGVTRQQEWMQHSFGARTPWGDQDSPVLAVAAESAAERALSTRIMRGATAPQMLRLREGTELLRQGEPGTEVFLVLDGVLDVLVDGDLVAELGPGAVVGERAVIEGGLRTSTVTARTAVRVARVPGAALDPDELRAVAEVHRREGVAGTPPDMPPEPTA